jgi:hypothetical protein
MSRVAGMYGCLAVGAVLAPASSQDRGGAPTEGRPYRFIKTRD